MPVLQKWTRLQGTTEKLLGCEWRLRGGYLRRASETVSVKTTTRGEICYLVHLQASRRWLLGTRTKNVPPPPSCAPRKGPHLTFSLLVLAWHASTLGLGQGLGGLLNWLIMGFSGRVQLKLLVV